jgi:hypothetical protein
MLVVKMMSSQNLADDNVSKEHTLYTATRVVFKRVGGRPMMDIYKNAAFGHGEVCVHVDVEITGNVYVMDNGKTIDTYSYSPFGDSRYIDFSSAKDIDSLSSTDGETKAADRVMLIENIYDLVKLENMIDSSKPTTIMIDSIQLRDAIPEGYEYRDKAENPQESSYKRAYKVK